MELQADGAALAELRLRIGPVEHLLPVDGEADAIPDREDLHLVPVVLLAGLLRLAVLVAADAVAPVEVVEAPAGGKHHEVPLVARGLAILVELFSPDGHAGVHLARRELALEEQPEVAIRLLRQQVGAHLRGVFSSVAAHDLGAIDRPVGIGVPLPALEVAAVEELHGLRLLLGRQVYRRRPVGGGGSLARSECNVGRGRAVILQFAGGPERAAGDEVEKLGHPHGLGVVADRRAKDTGLVVVVGPDHRLVALPLAAHRLGKRRGGRKQLVAKVELLLGQLPFLRQAVHDRMLPDDIRRVFVVGPVAGRLDAAELEPVVVTGAVAVHRAVHEHGRHALLMFGDDPLHELRILDGGEALVVEDHVVALRPVGLGVDRHLVVGARAPFVDDRDLHPRPRRESLGDHLLLAVIVVAAATGDVEHLKRLARLRSRHGSGEKGRQSE